MRARWGIGNPADRLGAKLTAEWFPAERAFFDDPSPLSAACCGRRAGKTRGLCRDFVREALAVPGFRGLYLNSTRGEAERLAWYGNRNDGMAALVEQHGVKAKLNQAKLTIYLPETDAWIYLRGADDEAELRKALGGAYHKVVWDEAQKIPPKLGQSIREVFFPALLDFGGRFCMTGTPVRNMSGLFWDVTRPEVERRLAGWSVHHWTLLDNPFFGDSLDERYRRGVSALQRLYGGPEAAPIDSPIMQREAFGRWVREDAAYVYHVHKVPSERLLYAPHRLRADGFVDVPAALEDLPFDYRQAQFALGADLGYKPDPFALVLWAWHAHDPKLYEVVSWQRGELTADEQVKALLDVRKHVAIGIVVADAGGAARATVAGWSREWVERYNLPILEAAKSQKNTFIEVLNSDIVQGNIQLRDGGPLYDEMSQLQWSSIVSGTGRLVEDPTLSNHNSDAALYSHRHSYAFRWRPAEKKAKMGTRERYQQDERELEDDVMDELQSRRVQSRRVH